MKRWAWLALGAIAAGIGLGWGLLAYQDRSHRHFYETGAAVQNFLKAACGGLKSAATSPPASATPPFRWDSPHREGEVTVYRAAGGAATAGDPFDALAVYAASLESIETIVCKINLIEATPSATEVTLTVKFILDGFDGAGRALQDRLFFRWWLQRQPAPGRPEESWRIVRHELVSGIRVAGHRSAFLAPAPAALGIPFVHRRDPKLDKAVHRDRLRFGLVEHAGAGLSAADYDGDGRPDLLLLDGVESRLYRNRGVADNGLPHFEDTTAAAGLEGIGEAHSALFADLDNDGHRDLFIARYLASNRLFRGRGDGSFEEASANSGLDDTLPATSATALDFDRDGLLDLYVAAYGNAFETFPRLPFFARNGAPNRLYRNLGNLRFEEVTTRSGTGDTGWSLAVTAGDVNDDGWPDLAVANDFGRKNLYRNEGDGTFTEIAREAGVLDFSGGMGVAFGDFDNDGLPDLYTSNINSNQRWFGEDRTAEQYLRNVLRSRWLWKDWEEFRALHGLIGSDWIHLGRQVGEGNSLFRNRGDGTFEELKESEANRAGWSWGVAFADLDGDTDLDLFAANGWISRTRGTDL